MKNNTDKVKKEKKTDNNEMKKIRLNIDFKKVLNKLKPKKEKVKENKNININDIKQENIENIDNICDYDVLIKAPDQGIDYWYILSDRGSNVAAATYIRKENIGIMNTWLSGSSTWYFTIKYTKLIETIN